MTAPARTRRLRVHHETVYRYERPVAPSYNEARLTPMATGSQLVLSHRLDLTPSTSLYRYTDYWGSTVHAFDVHHSHESLSVRASSVIEVLPPAPLGLMARWDAVESDAVADRYAELLAPTRYVPLDDRLREVARSLRSRQTPLEAGDAAVAWLQEALEYAPGATHVHTTASEALDEGRGVCQDFAHLLLAVLRASGIPARYVSGYREPDPGLAPGQSVRGESHAWVEMWVGEWVGLDATSQHPIRPRHVVVAVGRDYGDVSPLRGVYHGGGAVSLDVTVEVSPVAA